MLAISPVATNTETTAAVPWLADALSPRDVVMDPHFSPVSVQ